MRRNAIKRSIVVALVFAISLFAAFAFTASATESDGWSAVTAENAIVGDEFSVPERSYFKAGEKYDVTHIITLPDGRNLSSRSITLSSPGKYTVTYVAKKGDTTELSAISFVANYPLVSVQDSGTTAKYIEKGDYAHAADAEGLYLRIQQSDEAEINDIITIDTSATSPITLCKFFVAPDSIGVADFGELRLKFTDVTDENNYLTVVANLSPGAVNNSSKSHTYFLAGGNGQYVKGVERRASGDKVHVDDGYGIPIINKSFYGYGYAAEGQTLPILDMVKNQIELRYDPSTQQVLIGNNVVIDLDDKTYFGGETDVLWKGFKSGKVKLSMYADRYNGSTANVIFTEIKDVDLAAATITDDTPPVITVLSDYDTDNMPEARAGEFYYEIPSATAFDLMSGSCSVRTEVYYNYNSAARTSIAIENGKFKTRESGSYAIVYTACDSFGNEATEIVWIHAGGEIAPIEISIPADTQKSAVLGKAVEIPEPIITGGSGNKTYTAFVAFAGEEKTTASGNKFTPEKSGVYTVTYVVTDYTGKTAEYSYEVTAVVPDAPYFTSEAVFPAALVNGFEYTLPEIEVADYTKGSLSKAKASVKVKDASGEKTYLSGEAFTPHVNANGDKITITYTYSYDGKAIYSEEKLVPVIKGVEDGTLYIENYFYSPSLGCDLEKTNLGLTFAVTNPDKTEWTFANALSYADFSLSVSTFAGANKFGSFEITLADYNDRTLARTIELCPNGGAFALKIGDEVEQTTISTASDSKIELSVKGDSLIVNNVAYSMERIIKSDKIVLSVALKNAQAGAKYRVNSVYNHKVTDLSTDRIGPMVSVSGDYGGTFVLGDEYYIQPATAFDVVSPSVNFTLTVKNSDRKIVKDVNGLPLDGVDPTTGYTIRLDEYTKYTITYTAKDLSRGNNTKFEYSVSVEDNVAPTLLFTDAVPATAKKGTTLTLPRYTAQDNVSASENISIETTIYYPNGRSKTASGEKLTFSSVGVYKIVYVAYDEAGNFAVRTFEITVTE